MNSHPEDLRWLRKHLPCSTETDLARLISLISVRIWEALLNHRYIVGVYDVSMNPEFIEGKKSKDTILKEFLNNFDGAKGNNDGVVSKQEWLDYYTDLSMSLPSDEYFVRMMESTW